MTIFGKKSKAKSVATMAEIPMDRVVKREGLCFLVRSEDGKDTGEWVRVEAPVAPQGKLVQYKHIVAKNLKHDVICEVGREVKVGEKVVLEQCVFVQFLRDKAMQWFVKA